MRVMSSARLRAGAWLKPVGSRARGIVGSNVYSTSFDATENPISESGKWVNGQDTGLLWSNVQTGSGQAYGSRYVDGLGVGRYADPVAILSTSFRTFSPNQYVQGTVYRAGGYNPGANHEIELLVRWTISANNAVGYEVLWNCAGGGAVVRWDGGLGIYTEIDTGLSWGAPADGDVMRVEISGVNLVAKINGGTVLTTDVTKLGGAYYSSGQPGIGFWPVFGLSTLENYGWKDFEAGDL